MLLYLEKESPKLHERLQKLKPTKLDLQWGTTNNFVDCGIFAMRHMETYFGKTKKWECGLSVESDDQHAELNDLRLKYLAKILLSEVNELRETIMSKVKEFEELDDKIKNDMRVNAHKMIKERVKQSLD